MVGLANPLRMRNFAMVERVVTNGSGKWLILVLIVCISMLSIIRTGMVINGATDVQVSSLTGVIDTFIALLVGSVGLIVIHK